MSIIEKIDRFPVACIIPVIFLILWFLVIYILNQKKNTNEDPEKVFVESSKRYRAKPLYYKKEAYPIIYVLICCTLILFMVLVAWAVDGYYIAPRNISDTMSIIMTISGMAITVALACVIWNKQYYVFFSMTNVMEKYDILWTLNIIIGSFVTAIFTSIIIGIQDESTEIGAFAILFFEITAVYSIILGTYVLIICIRLMLSPHKMDLRLLNQLHKIFGVYKVDTKCFENIEKNSLKEFKINLQYLLEEYEELLENKKLKRVKWFKVVNILENKSDSENDEWKKKVEKQVEVTHIIMSILLLVVCLKSIWSSGHGVFYIVVSIIDIVTVIGSIVLVYLPFTWFKSMKVALLNFYSDIRGYRITLEDGVVQWSPCVAIKIKNVYDKYVEISNSIIALFYIVLFYKEKPEEYTYQLLNQMVDILCMPEEQNKDGNVIRRNTTEIIPIFAIGYFMYVKGMDITIIKEKYNCYKGKEKEDDELFNAMMSSELYYLMCNLEINTQILKQKIDDYLKLLQAKADNI